MSARGHLLRQVQATPADLRSLATQNPQRFPVLLDSATLGALGRFSILGIASETAAEQLLLWGDGRLECQGATLERCHIERGDFLGVLDEWWRKEQSRVDAGPPYGGADLTFGGADLPFRGGWMVYLGYELAAHIEAGLNLPMLPPDRLCAFAVRTRSALVFDHHAARCTWIGEADSANTYSEVEQALTASTGSSTLHRTPEHSNLLGEVIEQDPDEFRSAVLKAQNYVACGDIYQANLSRRWRVQSNTDRSLWGDVNHNALGHAQYGRALYERLRESNPAPFAAYATLPTSLTSPTPGSSTVLLSSSPERLVRVRGGVVETRPIAGTRARRGHADTDQPETQELLANPKERAEHVMLIDLERNDLGRVCEAGTVEVNEFMVTESYPHLHHIVSNVRGRLRNGVSPGEILRAVFPGGTITGCPKYRCMQIIGELEGVARGAYTGSLGYLNVDGDMDLNILIRTATLRSSELEFRAGAGIVADSDWQRELAETRSKAQAMLRAFG